MSASFPDFLRAARQDTDAELERLLPPAERPPARLHQAMRYSVFAGGKRIRPALVLLAGETLGAARADLLGGAAALELLHTFSLVHDDLPALDDDDLRRGRPTVHREFDEATAILVGDALLNLGLAVLAREPGTAPSEVRRRAVDLVAEAVGTSGMMGGQMFDLEAERDWPEDAEAALQRIHRAKTGALLKVAVRLGGLYAGATESQDRQLAELGERLGLLFQITDDILDVEGTEAAIGKTVGKDARARKLTYPGLYGLADSRRRANEVRREALELAHELQGDGGPLADLIHYVADRDR